MKFWKLVLFLILNLIVLHAFAAEPVAKEDTTPPGPEGALTANDIPPITSTGTPLKIPGGGGTQTQSNPNPAPTGLTVPVGTH